MYSLRPVSQRTDINHIKILNTYKIKRIVGINSINVNIYKLTTKYYCNLICLAKLKILNVKIDAGTILYILFLSISL